MRILAIRTFDGVSIYAQKPVMVLWVSLGRLTDTASTDVAYFTERLISILPGLAKHCCSAGVEGGFVRRLQEGTYPAHIMEHIILEMQAMLGDDVRYGKTREVTDGIYRIVTAIHHPKTAVLCARIAKILLERLYRGREVVFQPYENMLRQCYASERLGTSTTALAQAAQERDVPLRIIQGQQMLLLGWGKHRVRMWATISDKTSLVGADISSDKSLTSRLLEESGIRVPRHYLVESLSDALAAWRKLNRQVVVKPLCGHQGKGVTVGVHSVRELDTALRTAQAYGKRVMLEQQIRGREYRLLVVNGKMVACAERIPAYVRGDGQSSVRELICRVNRDVRRGDGHDKALTKIRVDASVKAVLAKAGYSLDDVVPHGEIVYLRHSANLSTGGTAVDVTDIVHPDTKRLAERAATIVGLDIAGIDIIADNIACEGVTVIEVNAAPGIRMHHSPAAGQSRDVAGAIIDYLMQGTNGRIPLVAITGTNGKTTVTRLIAHIWRQTGLTIGMTTTSGIYRGEECLTEGDTTGVRSANLLLSDRTLDGAVLETARGGIIRDGLAFDRCDVGIITNISDDHLGQDGIVTLDGLAQVKSLITESVKKTGHAIINADDDYAPMLAERASGEVVFVSLHADNRLIRHHLAIGGVALFLQDGAIRMAQGNTKTHIADLDEVPITLKGRAKHQIENCLLASAGAIGLGLSCDLVRAGLMSFTDNQGRMMLCELGKIRVCIDYGHNLAGYRAVLHTVRQLGANRLVGVIGAPGDRGDETLLELGRIAGEGFARLYIKEDRDRRGRVAGETATLLAEGACRGGAKTRDITLLLRERDAVRHALTDSREGDLIVIFYEDYNAVISEIDRYRETISDDEQADMTSEWQPSEKHF